MKPRVLMTASTFLHISNFHLPYIKEFSIIGWEVCVACGGEPMSIPFADRTIWLPLKKNLIALDNLVASRILRLEMKARRYDLVITHTSLAAFFTRLALIAFPNRPRCVNVVHGYLFDNESNVAKIALYTMAERLVSGVTDWILTMNQYDFTWAKRQFSHTHVDIIPGMGADETRIRTAKVYDFGFPEGSVTLIFAGEFSKRKNQAMLVRAMPCLADNIHLVLPGKGIMFDKCQKLAKALGVEDRVHFPGYVKNIIPMVKAADIAVSASRLEGLPFNLIEAMQCGLPIVASLVKGHDDLVEDGINGYLYAYNDVHAYVKAVDTLVASRELRVNMGRKSMIRASHYELQTVSPQVMAAYQRVFGKKVVDKGKNS